ncbi:MAG: hypothetical protein KJ718_05405 [Nanoarchaeota archaeon]|nr:hypothetical protein [Nanoarchaeota archaeon]MBU1051959.1 hypothetical protein [Nanoarchaeota archaeon]MBU1988299.1 hypothetical protein [Nanoarchaeota archaeon]
MAKRKKRLEKGIESIGKQIDLHKEKIKKFGHEKEYLEDYWKKQIEDLEKRKKNREEKLKKEED